MSDPSTVRLQWHGKSQDRSLAEASLSLLRDGEERVTLLHGENLAAMSALFGRPAQRFALAYLDPPFLTGREHSHVTRRRDQNTGTIHRKEAFAFDDRWGTLDEYLSALMARVEAARELLSRDGCLVLHVDPKTSHYAKVVLDEVFGPRCFASEIVWRYRRWPAKTRNFQRVHDTLLRYVRDPDETPRFKQLYEPLAPSTLATWGRTRQRAVLDAQGRRRRSSRTSEPTPGTPLGDVWEIGIVAPVARERTGYPTQKPEALLERIIEACTNPGDLVLDPYAGSGTTLAVAARLGRPVVGIDSGVAALRITRKRLRALGITPREEEVVLADARAGATRAIKRQERVA